LPAFRKPEITDTSGWTYSVIVPSGLALPVTFSVIPPVAVSVCTLVPVGVTSWRITYYDLIADEDHGGLPVEGRQVRVGEQPGAAVLREQVS
jgi:hypothetical protein